MSYSVYFLLEIKSARLGEKREVEALRSNSIE